MTQEDKQLLLKDICARLPYGVKVHIEHDVFYDEVEPYDSILTPKILDDFLRMERLEVKPYLHPMSSMTKKERKSIRTKLGTDGDYNAMIVIDYYNAHQLDYRGLIEKGLALEAPDYMYNFENND